MKKAGLNTSYSIQPMYSILKWWKLTLYEKMLIWVIFYCLICVDFLTLFAKLSIWVIFHSLICMDFLTLFAKLSIWVIFHCLICINIMTLYAKLLIWVIFAARKKRKNVTQISLFAYCITFPLPTLLI